MRSLTFLPKPFSSTLSSPQLWICQPSSAPSATAFQVAAHERTFKGPLPARILDASSPNADWRHSAHYSLVCAVAHYRWIWQWIGSWFILLTSPKLIDAPQNLMTGCRRIFRKIFDLCNALCVADDIIGDYRSATHLLVLSRTMLTFIQESVIHETNRQSFSIHHKGLWQTFSLFAGQHHTVLMPYWELCDLHQIELLRFQLSLHLTTEAEVPIL